MHRIVFIPRIILLLIIFLIGSAAIKAASNIEGVIKDTLTNEPLIGANVILVGTSLGAATDEAGQYIIRGIESGTYVIRVTYIGYETVEKQIQVKE
ncbi:MAG: carboxypeptidase-like regulatory domain-containing protein, partial [Ignavibacteria bacterium]